MVGQLEAFRRQHMPLDVFERHIQLWAAELQVAQLLAADRIDESHARGAIVDSGQNVELIRGRRPFQADRIHTFAVDEDAEQFATGGQTDAQTTPLNDFDRDVHSRQLIAGGRQHSGQSPFGYAELECVGERVTYGSNHERVTGSNGPQCERWGIPVASVTQHLRHGIPIGTLPALRERFVFEFQPPPGSDRKVIGQLPDLGETSGRFDQQDQVYQALTLLAEREATSNRSERLLNLFSELD